MGTAIPAVILGAVSVWLILFLLSGVFASLFSGMSGVTERMKFKSKLQLLKEADKRLQENPSPEIIKLLKDSFHLAHVKKDTSVLNQLLNHHLSILNRVLSIGEISGIRYERIGVLENLLEERSALLKSFLDYEESKEALQRKRKEKGSDTPDWALSEYKSQLEKLRVSISDNRASIEKLLDELVDCFLKAAPQDEETYH